MNRWVKNALMVAIWVGSSPSPFPQLDDSLMKRLCWNKGHFRFTTRSHGMNPSGCYGSLKNRVFDAQVLDKNEEPHVEHRPTTNLVHLPFGYGSNLKTHGATDFCLLLVLRYTKHLIVPNGDTQQQLSTILVQLFILLPFCCHRVPQPLPYVAII